MNICTLLLTLPKFLQWGLILVPIFSLAVAAITLVKNLVQIKLNNRIRRDTIVSDWLQTFMNNERMQMVFYKIEYSKFKCIPGKFRDSDEELEIDRLFRHFSNIAILYENGFLKPSDIGPIKYLIKRAVENPDIIKYRTFLDDWAKKSGTGGHPYAPLNKLCKEL